MAVEQEKDQRKHFECLPLEQFQDTPEEMDYLSAPDGPPCDARGPNEGDDLTLMLDLGTIQEEWRCLSEITTLKCPLTQALVLQSGADHPLQKDCKQSVEVAAEKAIDPSISVEEKCGPRSVGMPRLNVYALYAIWLVAFVLIVACLLSLGNLLGLPRGHSATQPGSNGQDDLSALPPHSVPTMDEFQAPRSPQAEIGAPQVWEDPERVEHQYPIDQKNKCWTAIHPDGGSSFFDPGRGGPLP